MMVRRLLIFLFLCLICLVLAPHIFAQNSVEEECATFVREVLEVASLVCGNLDGDNACYGHRVVEVVVDADKTPEFDGPGDVLSLEEVISLHTAPLNLDGESWGIAYLNLAPDSADETATRFLMLGDVTMENLSVGEVNAFNFSTVPDDPECGGAPNKVVIQSPEDSTTDLNFNGADFILESGTTLVLDAEADNKMTVLVVTGSVTITADNDSQVVIAGQRSILVLGGDTGLVVVSAPGLPEEFDWALIQFLPFRLLGETIAIPAIDRWTPTRVELEAGQSYLVVASELVKTIDYMPWSAPEGHSEADCSAAGRGDWDCRCRTLPEWGECTLDEVASMTLVGRIGEGEPFIVGAGGFFTAAADGELFLGPNDNTFTDNVGAYQAIIIAQTD